MTISNLQSPSYLHWTSYDDRLMNFLSESWLIVSLQPASFISELAFFQAAGPGNVNFTQHYLRYSKVVSTVSKDTLSGRLDSLSHLAPNPIIVVSITTILVLALAIHILFIFIWHKRLKTFHTLAGSCFLMI